ncbi:peptide deformylase [Mameliella sediminis]|uniref:peptide deformylase n=1 Tax=Mameliella sediminis TaxID=2836866 RepID=UPI001C44B5ED|nr:peptide deformylase [Mameliella sediminis]MBY6113101.1 peptide deformylase [Antarctobacter heliothermus]MBY6143551.1 peptide deformylase [Mameliella alba]MCA0952725.1 peptide deformylase [Mameliella alba]
MSILPILTWPDTRLAQPCAPVDDPAGLATLVADMLDTMYDAPGRGLAAPQVGVMRRVFVMDSGWKDGDKAPLVCINPAITPSGDSLFTGPEGCLSVPGVTAEVTRPAEVTLGFTDLDGVAHQVQLSGAAATIAQHELDHLDGIMHFDRLDPAARDALLADYQKASDT